MGRGFKESVARAAALMGTPNEYAKYVSLKVQGGLCCPRHYGRAWNLLDQYITPCGPLKDQGDILVEKHGVKLALEHEESGSEIIAYLGKTIAKVVLAKSVLGLAGALANAIGKDLETRRDEANFTVLRMTVRRWSTERDVLEEKTVEATLPVPHRAVGNLGEILAECLGLPTGKEARMRAHELWDESYAALDALSPSFETTFRLGIPEAQVVQLAGSFNFWKAEYMSRRDTGEWMLSMRLPEGKYLYKFVVDGWWMNDPVNRQTEGDQQGNLNSVLCIARQGSSTTQHEK